MILTGENLKGKFERAKDMPQLKREIIKRTFDYVSRKPYNQWWKYSTTFHYDGHEYELEIEAKMDNQVFTYRHMHIAHKTIEIDIDDMIRQGLMND